MCLNAFYDFGNLIVHATVQPPEPGKNHSLAWHRIKSSDFGNQVFFSRCFFQGDFAELTGGLILFMVHSVFKNHGHQHQENLWNAYGKDVCSAWPFFFLPAARR